MTERFAREVASLDGVGPDLFCLGGGEDDIRAGLQGECPQRVFRIVRCQIEVRTGGFSRARGRPREKDEE